MTSPTAAGALLLACLIVPGLADAQVPADDPIVLSAAGQHLVGVLRQSERLPHGTITLDRRVLTPSTTESGGRTVTLYNPGAVRDAVVHAELRRHLGAVEGDFDDATVCATESPRSCRLRKGVAAVSLSAPRPSGEGTEVIVAARWTSDLDKMPVGWGRFSLILVRCEDGWRVRSMRTLAIS
jgi:hypothetical protein